MPQIRSAKASASPSIRKAKSIPRSGTQGTATDGISPLPTAGTRPANHEVAETATAAGRNRSALPRPDPPVVETLSAKALLVALEASGRRGAPTGSGEAGNRTELRRRPVGEVEHHL